MQTSALKAKAKDFGKRKAKRKILELSNVEGPAPQKSRRSKQDDDDKESDMPDLDGKNQISDPLTQAVGL